MGIPASFTGGYLVGVAEEACRADFEDIGSRN
jgi:hypothetical protein